MKTGWKNWGVGAGVGIVNGIFGGGGGMLAVPALRGLGLAQKKAHATAILVILPVCLLSLIPYFFKGYWSSAVAIPTAIGVVSGGLLGAKLLSVLSGKWVNLLFALLQALAGGWMLFGS